MPPYVHHGKMLADKTVYKRTASLQCDDGYEPIGRRYADCQPDGTWSNIGECHRKSLLLQVKIYWSYLATYVYTSYNTAISVHNNSYNTLVVDLPHVKTFSIHVTSQ